MARTRAFLAVATALVALLAVTSSADAQRRRGGGATPPAPTAEQRETARVAYGRGQELFRAGTFAEAQVQFEAAFAAVPNPVVLLSIAECQERQNLAVDAVATLERYLAARTDAPDRAAVEQRVVGLRARPATLVVSSTPPGAAISVDGTATGRTTPAEVTVPPGDHTVALTLAGHEPGSEQVTVTFGARREVTSTLAATAGAAGSEEDIFGSGGHEGEGEGEGEEPVAPPPPPSRGVGAPVWIAAGIGGAALVTGTVLGFLALDRQSEFNAMPSHDAADSGKTLALFADVGFGVAAAGIITAIVLYATSDAADEEDEAAPEGGAGGDPGGDAGGEGEGGGGAGDEPTARRPARGPRISFAPVIGPTAGGVVAGVRF